MPGNMQIQEIFKGPTAVFECEQNIPCNPCVEACPRGAIRVFANINDCPSVDAALCNGCGICLTRCPGLSIFVVDQGYTDDKALLKLPYEFIPLPNPGDTVHAVDREGKIVGSASVIRSQQSQNKTAVIWITVPKELAMTVRHIKRQGGTKGE